jgi:Xaa-Pro aminopeptidase
MASTARDENLDALRELMAAHSPPLHALVVPSEDAHQVSALAAARADRDCLVVSVDRPPVQSALHSVVVDCLCVCVCVQSEYVSERDKRREFISGFTGSAGEYRVSPASLHSSPSS